jgi:hypothetical protein
VWLQDKYGGLKAITATRGKQHNYLGMTLDYSMPKKLKVNMCKYIKHMLDDAPIHLSDHDKAKTPAGENLFTISSSKLLDNKGRQAFHTCIAKGLFVAK